MLGEGPRVPLANGKDSGMKILCAIDGSHRPLDCLPDGCGP
jgi:hypothetical protein